MGNIAKVLLYHSPYWLEPESSEEEEEEMEEDEEEKEPGPKR